MTERKLTYEQLVEIVRSRKTKGSAFSLDHKAYTAMQDKVRAELSSMSYADILAKYPEYTYDVKA